MSGLDDAIKEKSPPGVLQVRRVGGYGVLTDRSTGKVIEEVETLQCCHCGGHWIHRAGSGIRRGFCLRCEDLTCGKPECDPCRPMEGRLEALEKEWWDDYHAQGGQMGR